MSNSINKLVEELTKATQKSEKTYAYDADATVIRVENGKAYVKLGEAYETPVDMNIAASPGDRVKVRVANGRAYIMGNASQPPTGDRVALNALSVGNKANYNANSALSKASSAQDTADEAGELAGSANSTANNARRTANSILIYDHEYEYDPTTGIATFTAYLYRGGVDVKTQYDPECFTWFLKKEEGEEPILNSNNNNYGYTCEVNVNQCGFGAEVVGKFEDLNDAYALSENGSQYTDVNNNPYTVQASGDSIRVRDLTVVTTLYPTEKVMIVGLSGEHLATLETLSDAVDKHYVYTQSVVADTWNINHNLNKFPSISVVDSAESQVEGDVEYVDANNVTLRFCGAFSGKAYLN